MAKQWHSLTPWRIMNNKVKRANTCNNINLAGLTCARNNQLPFYVQPVTNIDICAQLYTTVLHLQVTLYVREARLFQNILSPNHAARREAMDASTAMQHFSNIPRQSSVCPRARKRTTQARTDVSNTLAHIFPPRSLVTQNQLRNRP